MKTRSLFLLLNFMIASTPLMANHLVCTPARTSINPTFILEEPNGERYKEVLNQSISDTPFLAEVDESISDKLNYIFPEFIIEQNGLFGIQINKFSINEQCNNGHGANLFKKDTNQQTVKIPYCCRLI